MELKIQNVTKRYRATRSLDSFMTMRNHKGFLG